MGKQKPVKVTMDDGRVAELLSADIINYIDGFIESGYVRGLGEDDFYIRLHRDASKTRNAMQMVWCARRDELEAFMAVAAAALYIDTIAGRLPKEPKRKRKARK
jgi:hypothetical protein